ncbi:hypothetical protein [Brachymonas sp.]|uniref:hypothetical protein n=1 Tax=Brachymonas sp. TaxID=1936292 RepID=UPI0035B1C291
MKTKHRKAARHKHERRNIDHTDALGWIMRRTQPLTQDEVLREMAPIYDAMSAVDAGHPSDDDKARLLALGCAVRARGLAIDPDNGAILGERVADACVKAYRREHQGARFGFNGEERSQVLNAIELWDQMLEHSQPHEIQRAGREGAEYAAIVCAGMKKWMKAEH